MVMGYCINYEEGCINIKKENMKLLLEKLSDFFQNGERLKWVNGFDIEDIEDMENEIYDIWSDLRYEIEEDDDYYSIIDFTGEKYGDDEELFKLISPYCEDGYLQFCDENGDHFRFVIKNGEFKEVYADLSFDE